MFYCLSALQRVRIVKLLTEHVVRSESWVPTNGSPPCYGELAVICIRDWFEIGCHFSSSLIRFAA